MAGDPFEFKNSRSDAECIQPEPLMSVVVPSFNCEETIGKQLFALENQKTQIPFEVIVVDNKSTDSTRSIVEMFMSKYRKFTYVEAFQNQGVNYARNVGVNAAKASFISLCDADDVVTENWVESYFQAFVSGENLLGGDLWHFDQNTVVRETQLNYSLGWLPFASGANCGFSRAAFEALGGFDETFHRGGDETDFFWRAQLHGFKLTRVLNAPVLYTTRPNVSSEIRQKYFYGMSHAKLYSKFKKYGMPRSRVLGSLFSVSKALALAGLSLLTRRDIRPHMAVLSMHLGRMVGSSRYGVIYL